MKDKKIMTYGDCYKNKTTILKFYQYFIDEAGCNAILNTKLINGVAVDVDRILSILQIASIPSSDYADEYEEGVVFYDPDYSYDEQKLMKMDGLAEQYMGLEPPLDEDVKINALTLAIELLLPDKVFIKALHDVLNIGDGEHYDSEEKRSEYAFADGGNDSSIMKLADYLELSPVTVVFKLMLAGFEVADDNTIGFFKMPGKE